MRKMRKILTVMLAVGVILGDMGVVAGGQNFVAAQEFSETPQAEFSFDEATGCLTFFGEGAILASQEDGLNEAGMKYKNIGDWKEKVNPSKVKSVVIQEGVTNIEANAFSYVSAEKVTIAGSVRKIGAGAFGACKNLKEVVIGEEEGAEPMEIGDSAFADCEKLEKITLGKNVGSLGERFVGMASSLTKVLVSAENPYLEWKDEMLYSKDGTKLYLCTRKNVKEIAVAEGTKVVRQLAFAGVPVKKVRLAASVEVLEAGAFQDCDKLKKVVFASGSACRRTEEYYRYFGDEVEEWYTAFGGCGSLKEISFGDKLETLSENTFMNCSSLTKISLGKAFKGVVKRDGVTAATALSQTGMTAFKNVTVARKNKKFCAEKGVLYTKTKDMLCMYPIGKTAKKYVAADCVKIIGQNAFAGNKRLKKVVLGSKTKQIQEFAFYNNTALISVDMGRKTVAIGERAFAYCTKLSVVRWSEKLKKIGDYAFCHCEKMKSIVFDKTCAAVAGRGAFQGCHSVTTVVWPKKFTKLGAFAFGGCKKITSAVIKGKKLVIPSSAFIGCTLLENVTIGKGITQIGQYAFYGCTSLKKIKIPSSVTLIGEKALGCKRAKIIWKDEKVKNFVIIATKGSAAYRYARKYDFAVQAVSV